MRHNLSNEADEDNREKASSYRLCSQIGKLKFYDSLRDWSIVSISLQPLPDNTGLGFDFFSVDEFGSNRDKFYSFIPTMNFQNQSIGIRLGFNAIKIVEGEGPEGLIVPVLGIKIGDLRKFFLSAEIFSDMYVYPYSARINYVFDNYFSNFMLGVFWGGEASIDYFGYTCKIEWLIYKRVFFSIQGNLRNYDKDSSFRVGLGCII